MNFVSFTSFLIIIVCIGLAILVIESSWDSAKSASEDYKARYDACYSQHGTVNINSCGLGCKKTTCILKDGNNYVSKDIFWADGNYHLVEAKT